MNERQKSFVESVVRRQTPENRELLETIVKAYVLNEGIIDRVKTAAGKVANRVREATKVEFPKPGTEEFKTVPNYASLYKAMKFEPDCWERDFNRFEQNCEMVKYYLASYGIKDFNAIVTSEPFKEALKVGAQLDRFRKNPLIPDDARKAAFRECLTKLSYGEHAALVEAISLDFAESETSTVELPPMFEAREDNLPSFKEAMAGIANFIRRHGVYPWNKFLRENRMLLSRAHRFDEQVYEQKEQYTPALAADVRKAYTSGYGADY